MPICPDCKASELIQSANPKRMTCTECKTKFVVLRLEAIEQLDGVACKTESGDYCLDYKPSDASKCEDCDIATLRTRLGVLLGKASTLNHDATQSHSLLSKGPDNSNIANVATTDGKQAKPLIAEKRGRNNIQT